VIYRSGLFRKVNHDMLSMICATALISSIIFNKIINTNTIYTICIYYKEMQCYIYRFLTKCINCINITDAIINIKDIIFWSKIISKTTDSSDTSPSEPKKSLELSRTTSRTEAVRQDVRRLKSVTLDRMGKMFRARTPVVERSFVGLDTVSDLDP